MPDLTGAALDAANHALNTTLRVTVLNNAMARAELDYLRTNDKAAYEIACRAAFAEYDKDEEQAYAAAFAAAKEATQ